MSDLDISYRVDSSYKVDQLKDIARERQISGYSKLRKNELIELINNNIPSEEKLEQINEVKLKNKKLNQKLALEDIKSNTNKNKRIEQELAPAITENILSDYIDFDELTNLQEEFEGFKLNINRIEVVETFYDRKKLKIKEKEIFVDEKLTKKEIWYRSGEKEYEYNYKNGLSEGKQYIWYSNRKMKSERNYKNGKLEGKQYGWYLNENLLEPEKKSTKIIIKMVKEKENNINGIKMEK